MPQDDPARAALRAIIARCKLAYGDPDLIAFGFTNTPESPFTWSMEEDCALIANKVLKTDPPPPGPLLFRFKLTKTQRHYASTKILVGAVSFDLAVKELRRRFDEEDLGDAEWEDTPGEDIGAVSYEGQEIRCGDGLPIGPSESGTLYES